MDKDKEISRLRAKLALAVEALTPLASHAKNRCVDDPAWSGSVSFAIIVTIEELRSARAALAQIKGEKADG